MSILATMVLAATVSGAQPVEPDADSLSPHAMAVKQFASVLAIAQVASDRCADILVNMPMLDDLRDQLGMTVEDKAALKGESDFAVQTFEKAFKDAPSPQVWCDAAYRMYGPEGRMIRGFMIRAGATPAR